MMVLTLQRNILVYMRCQLSFNKVTVALSHSRKHVGSLKIPLLRTLILRNISYSYQRCGNASYKDELILRLIIGKKGILNSLYGRCWHRGSKSLAPLNQRDSLTPSSWILIRKMMSFVWPKNNWMIRRRVIFALSLLISAKLMNICVPFMFKSVVDHYNESSQTLSFDSPVFSVFTIGTCLILAYGGARVGSALFQEVRNAVFAKVAQHSIRSVARSIFLHLHHLDLSFHLTRQTGALSKAIDRGTRGINDVLRMLVFTVAPTIFEIGLVTAVFYTKCGPNFAWVTVACIGTYSFLTLSITPWRTKFRQEMNQADNAAGNRAIDSLINYETVKYFNNEQFEADRYDHLLARYERASLKTLTSLALLNFLQTAIMSAGLLGVMFLAAHGIQTGTMTVGDMVMVNTLLFQLTVPLNFLGSTYRDISIGLIDMNHMFGLLNIKSRIQESEGAKALKCDVFDATIKFNDVWFGYLPGQQILKGLTMEIPTGKKVAVIGASGSGKSTIVRLLYRLYDCNRGQITIAGQNINHVQLWSLRSAICVVPQDAVLFHDSLFYNIKYGDINASDEKVYEASRTSDLHEAVLRMPSAYETIVGERGLKLSGGEKQRVAIARAILKNAPIIIYDEATSSLDVLTEQTIMASLQNAVEKKTSLFIAHRLATVVDADIIYVLADGKIAEKGDHCTLIAQSDSLYAALWRSQHSHPMKDKLTVTNKDNENVKKRTKIELERENAELLETLTEKRCCGGGCNR